MTRARPKVSVFVPTYNRAALLRQCLASLLAQTVRDFDIVVVDNASEEEPDAALRALGDPRVRLVRNETNLGSRGNWNRCLALADGEYVAICHDDDVYEPTFIEECARFLDSHPSVGFVHCDAVLTDPSGVPLGRFRAYSGDRVLSSREAFRTFLLESHNVVLSSVMARRNAYEAVGPFRAEFLCADYDMWLRLASRFDVGYIGRPLVRYRAHPTSTSQSMEASRWYREHRAIVEDALERSRALVGTLGLSRERVLEAVAHRWGRRYVREALSRLSHGDATRAGEYLTAARPLPLPARTALAVRLLTALTAAGAGWLLAPLRLARTALRRPAPAPFAANVLYVSYDGALEPLGRSQILPYLRGLALDGMSFVLLTFEKPADLAHSDDVARLRAELTTHGIRWIPLRYHKRPSVPATAWDILRGAVVAAWLARRAGARIVHCRSHLAGVMGHIARATTGGRFLFDMRGFWPEERVEGGVWPASGSLFRWAKRVERRLLATSDAIVVLTERAVRTLGSPPYRASIRPGTPVSVIPCCVEPERFATPNAFEEGGILPRTLVYAGSVGTWYLLEEMLDFYATARQRDPLLRLLILNRGEHDAIGRAAAARRLDGLSVVAAVPEEVPGHLRAAYAGLYFIKPVFSKTGASPTKLGEYLAAGLPVVVNAGVGDADELVAAWRVGVVVKRFTPDEYLNAWAALTEQANADPGLRARCRQVARDLLSVELGVARYQALYAALLETSGADRAPKQHPLGVP